MGKNRNLQAQPVLDTLIMKEVEGLLTLTGRPMSKHGGVLGTGTPYFVICGA